MSSISNIIKDIISPLFKDLGFRKKGNNFYRQINDIIQIFTVQQSQWNTINDKSFTFNIGIYNEDVYIECFDRGLPKIPNIYDCVVSLRISCLKGGYAEWYKVNANTNIKTLEKLIEADLINVAVPFFEKYITLESVNALYDAYDKLRDQGRITRISLLFNTGHIKEGKDILRKAYKDNLKPRRSKMIIRNPDSTQEIKWSKPRVNSQYLDFLKKIASKYSITIS